MKLPLPALYIQLYIDCWKRLALRVPGPDRGGGGGGVIVPCNITYTGLLVTTIFSPTQRCIVGTMLQPFETMSQ